MNLANKLTIFRIILVPIMVIIPFFNIQGTFYNIPIQWILLDIIFIIASITDKLDGYIARKRKQITTFGKFLDPIADKILVLTAMIMLVGEKRLPAWIPIIVLFREFIVSGYRLVAVQKNGEIIAASIWGKIKTVSQMIAIILMLIDQNGYFSFLNKQTINLEYILNCISSILITISVIATIISGWDYIKNGKSLLKD